jgi:hypothetical protein
MSGLSPVATRQRTSEIGSLVPETDAPCAFGPGRLVKVAVAAYSIKSLLLRDGMMRHWKSCFAQAVDKHLSPE